MYEESYSGSEPTADQACDPSSVSVFKFQFQSDARKRFLCIWQIIGLLFRPHQYRLGPNRPDRSMRNKYSLEIQSRCTDTYNSRATEYDQSWANAWKPPAGSPNARMRVSRFSQHPAALTAWFSLLSTQFFETAAIDGLFSHYAGLSLISLWQFCIDDNGTDLDQMADDPGRIRSVRRP